MLVGIFVGGRSSRMGRAKGLLLAPDHKGTTLVERLLVQVEDALPEALCVLVGRRPEYSAIDRVQLPDVQNDKGPLGGLVTLLEFGRREGFGQVLAIACDLPFLTAPLIRRLAQEHKSAPLVTPRFDERYQPLFARYSVDLLPEFSSALEREELSLMPLLKRAGPQELALNQGEIGQLFDWDCPEDITRISPERLR
jgi:molybdopterin-guanine dinucleotide biosynthesis protein A